MSGFEVGLLVLVLLQGVMLAFVYHANVRLVDNMLRVLQVTECVSEGTVPRHSALRLCDLIRRALLYNPVRALRVPIPVPGVRQLLTPEQREAGSV